jgi:hypothetical protein
MPNLPKFAIRAAAVAAVSALSGPAWAGSCALQDEMMALNTRVLQSELVVAALNCHESSQYNAFVQRFQPQLVASGVAFRNYFNRLYGPYGEQVMDEMVTKLANIAVMRSWALGPFYCPSEDSVFNSLLALDASQLANFAASRPYVLDHDILPCPVQAATQPPAEPAPAPQ